VNAKMKSASPKEKMRLNRLENFIASNDAIRDVGDMRIAFMEKSGIDMQIVDYGNNDPMDLPAQEANPLCIQANDELAEHIKQNPIRFAGLASLPVDEAALASKELERSVNKLGFKGAMLPGTYNGEFFDDPRFYEVFETAASLDVPIYMHPGFVSETVTDYYYSSDQMKPQASYLLGSYGLGWHFDSGVHVLRLILSGLFDKLPNLKIVMGHWGEMLPYYFERMDDMIPQNATELKQNISDYFKSNIYVSPSGLFFNTPAKLCIEAVGIDHMLWATDYPYVTEENTKDFLQNLDISEEDKMKISHQNAEKLFKL